MPNGFMRTALAAIVLAAAPAPLLAFDAERLDRTLTPFTQSVAIAAAEDRVLAEYYRGAGYAPIWTGGEAAGAERIAAFLAAAERAELHGLPSFAILPDRIRAELFGAGSARGRAEAEVALSRLFLDYARMVRTGIVAPSDVDTANKRGAPDFEGAEILAAFAASDPGAFIESLPPATAEYRRLVREKIRLDMAISQGSWGLGVRAGRLSPGDSGLGVVELRDRLTGMGYLRPTATSYYGREVEAAVEAFQIDHGIEPDGIAGIETLTELNVSPAERLGQVLVAMERERWMARDPEPRHVLVNLPEYRARIIVDGEVYFETKSIIGEAGPVKETPEFSDEMTHMVINPSWYVPRSIIARSYLPDLRRNPYAHGQMEITDSRGRVVPRSRGFAQFTARSFPYGMRQPPGPSNALGRVKFMFPNQWNIYLHDTPARSLFARTERDFSSGCIRLEDPAGFGHALFRLEGATDPVAAFDGPLATGRETRVNLKAPIPVHLIYRTAVAKPEGGVRYYKDIYGRDGRILSALRAAGVALPEAGG